MEVSLLESILDMQFEVITTFLNDGHKPPKRSAFHNAHAYLGAPYGIYRTEDGYIALAMGSIPELGRLIECPALSSYDNQEEWFTKRDEIKQLIGSHLLHRTTASCLKPLMPAGTGAPMYTPGTSCSSQNSSILWICFSTSGGPEAMTYLPPAVPSPLVMAP